MAAVRAVWTFKGEPTCKGWSGAASGRAVENENAEGREREKEREERREEFDERVVHLARTAKVVKGGRRFAFRAVVVVGDQKGRVGIGIGKAREVPDAIRKASDRAKKNDGARAAADGTIPHQVQAKFGAGVVMLKPASPAPASSPAAVCAP